MRKEFFVVLGLIIALLLIASCVPVAKYYVCADNRKVLDPALCNTQAQKPAEKITQPEEKTEPVAPVEKPVIPIVKELTPEAKALFDKFEKVKSIQYTYVESPNPMPENVYYTTRDKMKVMLITKVKFTETDRYDTVYLDLVNQRAVAYCEDKNICPDRNKAMNVDYNDYFFETPFDWMLKIAKANLTGRSKTLEARKAIEVNIEADGKTGIMYVDSFFSVPLSITLNGKTYDYRNIVINEVNPAIDLVHQVVPT